MHDLKHTISKTAHKNRKHFKVFVLTDLPTYNLKMSRSFQNHKYLGINLLW